MGPVERLVERLQRRVTGLVTRGVVAMVNDLLKMQELQVQLRAGDPADAVEHWLPYGFSAKAQPGAEVLTLQVGGGADHTVAICVSDRRFRLKGLLDGEVALYDDIGQSVKLGKAGIVVTASALVTVTAPKVELGGPGLLPTDGVVTGLGIDPFTGQTYFALGATSTKVGAAKA